MKFHGPYTPLCFPMWAAHDQRIDIIATALDNLALPTTQGRPQQPISRYPPVTIIISEYSYSSTVCYMF